MVTAENVKQAAFALGADACGIAPTARFDAAPEGFRPAGTVRVYSSWEYDRLGVEAIGFLTFLESAGLLDPVLRELIVDRAAAVGETPISIDKLKIIVLMVLWSQETEVDALILEELLDDGSPRELH